MFYARIQNGIAVEVVDLGNLLPEAVYHPDISADFISASEAVHTGWRWDGKTFLPPLPSEATEEALNDLKRALVQEVNAAAEAERKRYITAGEGQAMTYTEKLAQARAFLAIAGADPGDYPMIANEVGITATSAAGVAEAVIAAYTAWATIGAAIEKVRMTANKAIMDAADPDAARAIRDTIIWPAAG
ncbi:hypothetical protein SAMN05421890_1576 [Ensifer adhaerens]|nr:hypothetical protein SAMN05421890_1576 [Ensifer adhaerens]